MTDSLNASRFKAANLKLDSLYNDIASRRITHEKEKEYKKAFIHIVPPATQPSLDGEQPQTELPQLMKELMADTMLAVNVNHRPSLKRAERLLVGLMGHPVDGIREEAVKHLLAIYDGHDWQLKFAIHCV